MNVDYNPYEGRQVTGATDTVLSRGRVIIEDGSLSNTDERVHGMAVLLELAVLDDQPAARQHGVCRAGHLAAFVRVVVDVHVQRLRRERDRPIGIEDDDVGVRAWRNRAFARKEAEDLRRRRRGQLDEAVQRDAAGAHAAVVDQAHARLDAGCAVRDLREIVLARAAFPSCRTGSDRWRCTAGR